MLLHRRKSGEERRENKAHEKVLAQQRFARVTFGF
jgi:hypothetical protein